MRTRSVRISDKLDDSLKQESAEDGMTVNALITTVLDDYNEWGRLAKKFPFVSIPVDVAKSVWSVLDEQILIALARQEGSKIPREVMLFWFKEINLKTFMAYLTLLSRRQGLIQFEAEQTNKMMLITVRHTMGEKWSIWLRYYLEEAMKSNLGVAPVCEVSTNSIVFRFEVPSALEVGAPAKPSF